MTSNLDVKLPEDDRAAKRQKVNRSAPIRHALQEHLTRLKEHELEVRDRRIYVAAPRAGSPLYDCREAVAYTCLINTEGGKASAD